MFLFQLNLREEFCTIVPRNRNKKKQQQQLKKIDGRLTPNQLRFLPKHRRQTPQDTRETAEWKKLTSFLDLCHFLCAGFLYKFPEAHDICIALQKVTIKLPPSLRTGQSIPSICATRMGPPGEDRGARGTPHSLDIPRLPVSSCLFVSRPRFPTGCWNFVPNHIHFIPLLVHIF